MTPQPRSQEDIRAEVVVSIAEISQQLGQAAVSLVNKAVPLLASPPPVAMSILERAAPVSRSAALTANSALELARSGS
jgi:hypothetical protein